MRKQEIGPALLDDPSDDAQVAQLPDGAKFYAANDDTKILRKVDAPLSSSIYRSSHFTSGVQHLFKVFSSNVLVCTSSGTWMISASGTPENGVHDVQPVAVKCCGN